MFCPKCGSKARLTTNTRHNEKENETYKYRICNFKGCGYRFCTVEFVVEEDENFKTNWENAKRTKDRT